MSRKKRPNPSPRWMSCREVAELFGVSTTTVYEGAGVFGSLRRVPVTGKRVIFLRSDVERLDKDLEKAAVRLDGRDP